MQRERRTKAGNRMAKLLDEEEECQDDFYKENYGGFQETESDNEYQAEEEGEDIVDSDFSIDENDEPISDNEDEESQRKKRRLVTKAYKEPVSVPKDKPKQRPKLSGPKLRNDPSISEDPSALALERKSKRKSTVAKTAETAHRIKVRDQELKKKPKKIKEEEWMPTQEELLEEAKVTELENLKSLERYQKMESEKKTKRISKKAYSGPIIRYTSMRMPLIEDLDTDDNTVEFKDEIEDQVKNQKCYERTFQTLLNDPHDIVFKKIFNVKPASNYPKKLKCVVTGLPALYLDPITELPYRNSTCFKIIRQSYYQEMEKNGDKENPMVSDFLKWYAKNKARLRKEVLMHAQKINITS
ncbi:vacuolar protein sorting-associated protein 72 homolog isoform X1 [Euwallacea similis]|uniref:vacuolar protein sorting-associated protein 72 homolog isoform X1 n=1 Tax=Euwallacea similis TaxID=1736056 RepID=UPI0034501A71